MELADIKAVVFDFIGTLTSVKNYSLEASTLKLSKALVEAGFTVDEEDFLRAYSRAHEKYRLIRYEELVEVTNGVWISDALNCLGFKTSPEDVRVKTAVNVFFEDYLSSLELNSCARRMLVRLSKRYKLGLVSNFTYAPVIYAALRKLGINRFFSAVLVSEDVGWRKPNRKIFQEALRRLGAKAQETVYVGDSPVEDIVGAAAAGMRTIFVPSQFYTLENVHESPTKPDLIVKDICELCRVFPESAGEIRPKK
ncbi:MAG: HAD family hydrolase [Candidatus Bathyarchaeia archaeon]|jgi:FMN phosphatase YigB (HAD superfamily)